DVVRWIALVAVVDGNAMAPPELPRDVPVTNVPEPLDVYRLPPFRQDANRAVTHGLQGRAGERLHFDEPLIAQARLDNRVAAVAVTHRVLVRLHLHEGAGFLEHGDDL